MVASEQYETIAGWFIHAMGSVPQVGDELEADGYKFKVRTMRRRRIRTLQVLRMADAGASEPLE